MAVTLTKLIDGNPAISDTLLYAQIVRCPRCERKYRLGYSEGEWHRVKDWLKLAVSAMLKDHNARHEAATITLEWRVTRSRDARAMHGIGVTGEPERRDD